MEQPDIEKEVKRLFRTDAEAISTTYEIITEDEKPMAGESSKVTESSGSFGDSSGGLHRTDTSASLELGCK